MAGKVGQDGRVHLSVASAAPVPDRQAPSHSSDAWMAVYDSLGSALGEEQEPVLDNSSEVALKGERFSLWHEEGRIFLTNSVRRSRLSTLRDIAKQGAGSRLDQGADIRFSSLTSPTSGGAPSRTRCRSWKRQISLIGLSKVLAPCFVIYGSLGTDFVQHHAGMGPKKWREEYRSICPRAPRHMPGLEPHD